MHKLTRLMSPLSSISHSLYRGPNHLPSCLSKRYIQEFPERKANNQIPNDYVLILAEPLDEHEGTNELLKITKQQDIDYNKLDVETVYKGLNQALINFENYLTDVDNQQTSELKPSWEFFKDMERQLYPLDSAFNVALALMSIESMKFDHKELYELINRYYQVRAQRFTGKFKDSIQDYVLDGFKKLPESDKKMVRMYYKKNTSGSFLSSLDAKVQLPEYRKHLSNAVARFKYNLDMNNRQFSHTVDDPDILASISSDFDDNLSPLHHKERTPLKITATTYQKFMRVCPDRFVRQMLWQTYYRRCSPKSSTPQTNNIPVIENIRVVKRKIADFSGYRSHLDSRLSEAMADSKQQILDMLQYLNEENIKELNDRLPELTDYAVDNSAGQFTSGSSLEEYDIDYWTNRYTHDILIGQSEAQLRQYFSLPQVISGLTNYFKSYFGLEIVARNSEKPHYWDKNVQTLDVRRDDRLLGSIVFDPYFRANKQSLEPFYARIRCKTKDSGLAPVRLISTAFKKDSDSGHAHLSFLDIANLFHSFGIVIQRHLYNYDYYELNAYGALEVDVNHFLPNLCVAHLLTDHKILQSCSMRTDHGAKPIDSELASRMLKAHSYFRCLRIWRELYQAHLDLEAHASLRDIKKVVEDIYPIYSPFSRSSDNFDFCAFDGIFAGPNDGSQYSTLWSRQLVNFCLSESQTANNNNNNKDAAQVRTFNKKLIDTLLAPDNFNSKERLLNLLGRSFEPTKTNLRVI